MTPAEKAVIEAARRLVDHRDAIDLSRLTSAVGALDVERAPVTTDGKPTRWDQVVADDEIYSTATDKWYRVLQTVLGPPPGGKVLVQVEGVAKRFEVDAAATVPCRRSETGRAVDVWVQVMSSS